MLARRDGRTDPMGQRHDHLDMNRRLLRRDHRCISRDGVSWFLPASIPMNHKFRAQMRSPIKHQQSDYHFEANHIDRTH
jgi:hypothetical protein